MKNQTKVVVVTLLAFGVYFVLDEMYFGATRKWINGATGQLGVSHLAAYLIFGIPIYLGTLLLHGFKSFLESLGLNKPLLPGILAPLVFTLPMFIGFAFAFEFNTEITLNQVLIMVISAAFFEELFFRGFLFGQIYRYTRIGFIPAILLGALLFAAVHLYQSQDFPTLVGIFATTFLGAVFFAWLYAEWNFNLWIPIFMHLFMNLSWLMFSVSDNAFGNVYANIFRVLTIAAAITGTLVYKRKKGLKLEVYRQTVWMKGGEPSR
jgi:membrane protease YdiL (CAAX protease family)